MLRTTVLVSFLCALGASACTSSGYEQASATADKTSSYRHNLMRLGEQVRLAEDALRTLSENPGDSPASNRETFETYARELANLEDRAETSRKTYGKMDGRAERFFGGWTADTAQIENADLKRSAEERRAAMEANYKALAQGQAELDAALAAHVKELKDLRLYLEHDLTAAGIASARGTIQQAFASAAALQERIAAQARTTDSARDALVPLKDMAPTQPQRTGSSRVN